MLTKFRELSKLFLIQKFILGQALQSVRGNRRSSHLLTELYLDALGEKSRLPRRSLGDFIPGIEDSIISIYGKSHPYLTEGFADREALTSANETCALAAITRAVRPKKILEIGTAKGGSTYQFFLNSDAIIFTLDLGTPEIANEAIRKCFQSERIRVLTSDSRTFDFSALENVDMIFIDGGHDAETVLSDSENAFKIISKGGVVLWHDYKPSFPGVFSALNNLSRERKIQHIWGTSLAAYRHPDF